MITREEKRELLQSFKALDLNSDGILSRQELIAGYQKFMPYEEAEEEVERIMELVDKNNSKGIDYTGNPLGD